MSIREKERFRGTFCLAFQTAKELNLEYYTSDPKRLTLQEALYLIAPKKKLSDVAIPLTSNTFPWKVPNGGEEIKSMSKEMIAKVNNLLEYSMKIQMGTIPNTEFNQYILSNASLAVSGLLYTYLTTLGIQSNIGTMTFILKSLRFE